MPKIGFKHSEETKRKISLARKGMKPSAETRKKMAEACKRRFISDETRRKISLIKQGLFGQKNANWKGGKRLNSNGWVIVYNPKHPYHNCDGYVLEHRLVMEKHLGRYLNPEEVVHHINGVKNDNRIENLTLFKNNSEHSKFHHPYGIIH